MFKINGARKIEGKREAIEAIVGNVVDHMANLERNVKEQAENAVDRARKAGRNVNVYVKENPWQAAGVALAVGFLAGWLFKKKD